MPIPPEPINSIEDLAWNIKNKLDATTTKKRVIALYAFNATGKTRLSNLLEWMSDDWEVLQDENGDAVLDEGGDKIRVNTWRIKTLCYNAFLEDMFVWDNNDCILKFNPNHWTIKLIVEQWIEKDIINNFKDIINTNGVKLEPEFNFDNWEVVFKIASGDSKSASNIKISKGEESMLIWSVFYTILQTAIDSLNVTEDQRSTDKFNELKYIIIDDPVSSIDDTKIITMTIKLIQSIRNFQGNNVKFLITTHHSLFYNVLVNSFDSRELQWTHNFSKYVLSKDNQIFILSDQGDSPFLYHLAVKEIIQTAVIGNSIEKYHFNLFRNLLEKTSNFLGYKYWTNCIRSEHKQEFIRLLNLYSHSRLSDLESRELSPQDKTIFQETFNDFIQDFNWYTESDD